MASLVRDFDGWRVLFSPGPRQKRKTIRLGPVPEKAARYAHAQIERLVIKRRTGNLDPKAEAWLADIDDTLHDRVARTGLAEPRERARPTVGQLMTAYFSVVAVKPGTKTTYEQTRRAFEEYFGVNRPLADITPLDGSRWKQAMAEEGLAAATASKRVKTARQILRQAIRWNMLTENPLADVRCGCERNPDRLVFVPREAVERVLAVTRDPQWRCLIALSRYGALRVPSEALALRWEHVNWSEGRMTILSPKTAGRGRPSRVIPLFPELREHLLAAFEEAEPGAEFVITRYRDSACNLRTQFERLLSRAGLTAWPRLWHNMRASRATELAAEFASFVAAAWCGHTETIADAHYRMVRDEDYERALRCGSNPGALPAQNPAQHGREPRRTDAKQVA